MKSTNSIDQIVEYFQYYAKYAEQTNIGFTIHLYSDKTPEEIVDLLFIIARGVIFDWGLKDGGYNLEDKMAELFKLQVEILKKK